jgi:predicted TPR repeat methyltransferase
MQLEHVVAPHDQRRRGRVAGRGLSGVLFSGRVQISTGLSQGCSLIGHRRQITGCRRNIIETIDGRPALEVFKEDIGEVLARDPAEAEGAADAFRRYQALDPSDAMGAAAELARLGAAPVPERLPPAYVETLFDQEARRFDAMLGALGDRGPEAILQALTPHLGRLPADAAILDLGCGTGLIGTAVRVLGAVLDGIDLSENMLKEAARRGLYRALRRADLAADDWAVPGQRYDLIVAGDVFNYLGDLSSVLARAHATLAPGGLLVFTAEAGDEPGFDLGPARRYRHGPVQLRAWSQAALFDILTLDRTVIRQEARLPVEAWIMVLARRDTQTDTAMPAQSRIRAPRDGQGSA